MLVYRVETPSGVGPFYTRREVMTDDDNWDFGYMMRNHLTDETHPAPPYDVCTKAHRFGCDSIEWLRSWFNADMIEVLNHYGYVVKVFKVKSATKICQSQVAFKIKNAVLVETHPITILA